MLLNSAKVNVQEVLSSIYRLPTPTPPYTGGVSGGSYLKLTFWKVPLILVPKVHATLLYLESSILALIFLIFSLRMRESSCLKLPRLTATKE